MLENTQTIAQKMMHDIETILYWTIIVVQFIFLGYYGYSIYANLNQLIFLIIYSILAVLNLTSFITYIVTHHKPSKFTKNFKRALRIAKYVINGTMIGVNVYELIAYGATDFEKVLLLISGVSLLVQILMEFIRVFVAKYVELFKISLNMDLDPYIKLLAKVSKLTRPLKAKDEKRRIENYSEQEQLIYTLTQERLNKKEETKKEKIEA